jgi:hypothetical protein
MPVEVVELAIRRQCAHDLQDRRLQLSRRSVHAREEDDDEDEFADGHFEDPDPDDDRRRRHGRREDGQAEFDPPRRFVEGHLLRDEAPHVAGEIGDEPMLQVLADRELHGAEELRRVVEEGQLGGGGVLGEFARGLEQRHRQDRGHSEHDRGGEGEQRTDEEGEQEMRRECQRGHGDVDEVHGGPAHLVHVVGEDMGHPRVPKTRHHLPTRCRDPVNHGRQLRRHESGLDLREANVPVQREQGPRDHRSAEHEGDRDGPFDAAWRAETVEDRADPPDDAGGRPPVVRRAGVDDRDEREQSDSLGGRAGKDEQEGDDETAAGDRREVEHERTELGERRRQGSDGVTGAFHSASSPRRTLVVSV